MPSEQQYKTAKEITGSNISYSEMNIQYSSINYSKIFLVTHSIEQLLKSHGVTIEEGWKRYKDNFDKVAQSHTVDPAIAFCLFKDWESNKK